MVGVIAVGSDPVNVLAHIQVPVLAFYLVEVFSHPSSSPSAAGKAVTANSSSAKLAKSAPLKGGSSTLRIPSFTGYRRLSYIVPCLCSQHQTG